MTAAERIEQQAAAWLARREGDHWTAEQEQALEAWLAAAMAHKVAFWRLEHGWARADRLASLRPATSLSARPSPWRRRLVPAALAASLVAAILGVALGGGVPRPGGAPFETGVGERRVIAFSDGSRAELSTATRLRAAVNGDGRQAWLDRGEAYFEVRKDPSRPFVVWAGDRKVTVLGTKFSVRHDGDRVQVAVQEGRVRIDAVGGTKATRSQIAERGDILVAIGPSALITQDDPQKVADELSWRRGMLTFDQVTLGEAAQEFNRFNTRRLVIANPEAAAIRIGGAFEAQNVEAFASLLQSAYGLRVERMADRIEIGN